MPIGTPGSGAGVITGPIEVTQGTDPWAVTPNADPLPVTGPATNAQLRATPLPVAATLAAAVDVSDRAPRLVGIVALDAATLAALETIQIGSLPAVALDAATLAALETISVANFPALQPVSDNGGSLTVDGTVTATGPVTDAQLRASAVPVSGPLTDTQLRAAVVPISDGGGSLTVDGTVGATQGTTPWKAREDTAAMTWASVKSAAPGASAVQADTGALAAGDYDFDVMLLASDTLAVGKGLVIEHRNAANSATLQTLGGIDAPDSLFVPIRRYTLATNERLRIIAGTAAGAASSMYVSAIGRRVS